MKVEVAVLGSSSLINLMVAVDVKQHNSSSSSTTRAQELRESRGGRPGLLVPNSPYGLCGRKAALNGQGRSELRSCVKVEVAILSTPSLTVLMVSLN